MIKSRDWRYPRDTIAQAYKDNDYGYMFHAGMLFVEFLLASGLTAWDIRKTKILDYGCGTGRVSRLLSLTGAKVIGYDPTEECIAESAVEGAKAPPTSRVPEKFTSNFSDVGSEFDIVICINVLAHLTQDEQDVAINNIVSSLKENGVCYLWVHKHCHLPIVDHETVKLQATNTVIVRGTKINGRIESYERCNP